MKYHCRFFVRFVFLSACVLQTCAENTQELPNDKIILLKTDTYFILKDQQKNRSSKISEKALRILPSQKYLTIDGKKIPRRDLTITSSSGLLSINNREVQGTIKFTSKGNEILFANDDAKEPEKSNVALKDATMPTTQEIQEAIESIEKKITIRVLLSEISNFKPELILESEKGFMLHTPFSAKKRLWCQKSTLKISHAKDGRVVLNQAKPIPNIVYIKPKEGFITVEGRTYQGSFLLVKQEDKTLFINCLDFEDYVCSVLRTESWPGWPLEVNKVLAIACRTYGMHTMRQAMKQNKPYHIKNTNFHQTYHGMHDSKVIHRAVEMTKGQCLTYQGEPILAMFDSCCGGIAPAHIDGFEFEKAPYLARKYPCKFCKPYRIYSWKTEIGLDQMCQILQKKVGPIKKINHIRVTKKDKAGLVKEVTVKGPGLMLALSGKDLYSLMKEVKSFSYSIKIRSGKVHINGRGYGHHKGLCQWGTLGAVEQGWPFTRILKFYYPGTELKKYT